MFAANEESAGEHDLSLWLQVLDAMKPLTARQRTVLALTYVADLPQGEVARMLHISRSTVASTLADAKAATLGRDGLPPIALGGLEGLP